MSRCFRLLLHCHSDWSYDGHWPLERISRTFGRLGYDAVLMSEHDTGFDPARFSDYRAACAAASTARCTLLPGIEYSSPDNRIHILVWGLSDFLAEGRPVTETLERVAERRGVAVFAHPLRRDAWQAYDQAWTPLLSGMEVWNRKSDGIAPAPEAQRLVTETTLPPVVGLDFHAPRQIWPLDNLACGEGDLETVALDALSAGRLVPRAFRRPLIGRDGRFRTSIHRSFESVRVALRDLRRRRSARD